MSSAVDWSVLPPELLQTIAADLPTIVDYIFFRAVCRSWCASAQMKCCFLPRQFPCIIVPTYNELSSTRHLLFNHLTKKSFYGSSVPEFSEIENCIGSSFGRLILADGLPDGLIIFNPLNGEKTHLPSLLSFPGVIRFDSSRSGKEYTIQLPKPSGTLISVGLGYLRNNIVQVILTHDCEDHPNPHKPFAFVLSYRGFNLTYCKHDDRLWSSIDGTGKYNCGAVYLEGKLYLLNTYGSLAICNFNHVPPTVDFIEYHRSDINYAHENYLVDYMGELLWVRQFRNSRDDTRFADGSKTLKFDILKFDWSIKKWNQIKSLGNKALIVGGSSSMTLVANDYPGCRGNTIYFTGDYIPDMLDEVSMYDIGSETVEVLASYPMRKNTRGLMWATPLHV